MRLILSVASFISALGLSACLLAVVSLLILGEFASAISFAGLSIVWFILLVTTGYANVRLNS